MAIETNRATDLVRKKVAEVRLRELCKSHREVQEIVDSRARLEMNIERLEATIRELTDDNQALKEELDKARKVITRRKSLSKKSTATTG